MVIGNGFFSETKEDALREMTERSKCEVKLLPFPTIGNVTYYISRTGDLYGMTYIHGRFLTRQRKHIKLLRGFKARLAYGHKKEMDIYVQVLIYCAFVLNRWEPEIEIESINGNVYDVRPENLRLKSKKIPQEWSETMTHRQGLYTSYFMRVAWAVKKVALLNIEECKDASQSAFIYLCTDGYKQYHQKIDFVGLWIKIARFIAIKRYNQHFRRVRYDVEKMAGSMRNKCELDIFSLLPGKKRRLYTRLYYEGNTPTEIAEMLHVNITTVASSVNYAKAYLRKYYKNEIERWNHYEQATPF